jgi:NADPH-dependent 2,4-dienoyl-CoA reductase/sulfur reductase-like enzyme
MQFVILGNGIARNSAALTLRQLLPDAIIAMVFEES